MINVLHLSDIHYGWKKPEEDGVILDAFFDDLKNTLPINNIDKNYCIISGDLVDKGSNDYVYKDFFANFIKKLTKYIPISHIIVEAGNHDLNRNWVEKNLEDHKKDIYKGRNEVEFNEYIMKENCEMLKKFEPFHKFCKSELAIPEFNLVSYYKNIETDVSFFMLNTALCASGGANNIEDQGHLRIETSALNDWIMNNKGRTRVLVMHHPIAHLTDDMQEEINAMCRNGLEYIIAGHTHSQNFYKIGNALVIISPQLYSSKNDLNGYSVMHFDGAHLVDITYREWNRRFRKFNIGLNFTGTDDGKWINPNNKSAKEDDAIKRLLQDTLDNSMLIFGCYPKWIERKLTTQSPTQHHEHIERSLDYIDILNSDKSYQITAPAQFGLTCYAHYLSLKAWEQLNQYWIYVNAKDWTLPKVEIEIEKAHRYLGISIADSSCIIVDNWRNNYRDLEKITSKLKRILEGKRLILLTHSSDPVSMDLDTNENHEGFITLFLREIDRKDLRVIVNSIDEQHDIAGEDEVVERLNQDIIALNTHRIPYTSVQFMKAYTKNFDRRPVNRTKVLDYVLRAIFESPENLFYGDNVDEGNCKFIMGYFCQNLIEGEKLYFTEVDFYNICKPFAEKHYNSTNLTDLLQILKNNQILEPYGNSLQFRQLYWVSYFVALRKKDDENFALEMFEKKNAVFNVDLMDFYSGIDGRSFDAATNITSKLKSLSDSVYTMIGIDGEFNPFKNIKWRQNESKEGITQQQLEESIRNSRMPDDIKEVVADKNFDSVRPYTQQIFNFLETYEVRNLMQLLSSASRVLRNSEFIKPEAKEKLIMEIFNGWEVLMRVLFYISPLMAKNGFGGLGGARFKLSDDFPKEYAECLKQIIVSMPYNIILWYKNDFYSDKLTLLLQKYLSGHKNDIIRHLIALIICNARPRDFQNIISHYISTISKNSFFLGDLSTSLKTNYSYDFMTKYELQQTENLIKACYMKHHTGSKEPGIDIIAKFESLKGKLPERKFVDE